MQGKENTAFTFNTPKWTKTEIERCPFQIMLK